MAAPEIDTDECSGCGICVDSCPEGVLDIVGSTAAVVNEDSCIECGECERVCPMDLPLMSLNRELVKDMNELFGEYESGMTTENPDVLRTYDLNDLEEFM